MDDACKIGGVVCGLQVQDFSVHGPAVYDGDEHITRAQIVPDDLTVQFGSGNAFDDYGIGQSYEITAQRIKRLTLDFQVRSYLFNHGQIVI